jgi:hypothetical protein
MEPQILSLLGEQPLEECEEKARNPFEALLSNEEQRESELFAERVWKQATGKQMEAEVSDNEDTGHQAHVVA